MLNVKSITQARFNALCFSREPLARFILEELAWYADSEEKVLGFVSRDISDNDFGYILLGRDEIGKFRCIDMGCSFPDKESALVELFDKIDKAASDSNTVFPQGDVFTKKNEIYQLVVKSEKLNPNFVKLLTLRGFSSAKEIIKEAVYAYVDVDGNYIEQFQTTGFDSRIWELYLFVAFYEMGFKILREYAAPDYILEYCKDGYLCVEAVTVNPTQNPKDPIPPPPKNKAEIEALTRDYLPLKYASTLYSKLCKEYWKQPHIAGRPLLFAIADFHQEGSMVWSRTALVEYLYGIRSKAQYDKDGKLVITTEKIEFHEYMSTKRPSGFFNLPGAENISGVLFSNQGTISKFNRMGKLAGFGDLSVKLVVNGTRHDHDPNASEPIEFTIDVDDDSYEEFWTDGLTLYHNPNALHPLSKDVFPYEVGQFYLSDGVVAATLPDIYIYGSRTAIAVPGSEG